MNIKKIISIFSIFLILSINGAAAQNEDKLVVFQTKSGNLVIELFPNDAPNTVDNFLKLAESEFYDDTFFHRVIKDFMIQGGDPKTKPGGYVKITDWGTGNAGYTIDAEFNLIKHNRGIVSMARSADPNSASSQFFIDIDHEEKVWGSVLNMELSLDGKRKKYQFSVVLDWVKYPAKDPTKFMKVDWAPFVQYVKDRQKFTE